MRFAIRNGTASRTTAPSWSDQQKFGQFTPGDLAVIAFAYIGAIARLRRGCTSPDPDGVADRHRGDRGRDVGIAVGV